jgi:hypothetical protein
MTISPIPIRLHGVGKQCPLIQIRDQLPSSSSMHDSLAVAPSKCPVETVSVIFGKIISYKRLSPIFVDSLKYLTHVNLLRSILSICAEFLYLIRSCITQAWKE